MWAMNPLTLKFTRPEDEAAYTGSWTRLQQACDVVQSSVLVLAGTAWLKSVSELALVDQRAIWLLLARSGAFNLAALHVAHLVLPLMLPALRAHHRLAALLVLRLLMLAAVEGLAALSGSTLWVPDAVLPGPSLAVRILLMPRLPIRYLAPLGLMEWVLILAERLPGIALVAAAEAEPPTWAAAMLAARNSLAMGVLLPCVVLYSLERTSRLAFLAERRAGDSRGAAQAADSMAAADALAGTAGAASGLSSAAQAGSTSGSAKGHKDLGSSSKGGGSMEEFADENESNIWGSMPPPRPLAPSRQAASAVQAPASLPPLRMLYTGVQLGAAAGVQAGNVPAQAAAVAGATTGPSSLLLPGSYHDLLRTARAAGGARGLGAVGRRWWSLADPDSARLASQQAAAAGDGKAGSAGPPAPPMAVLSVKVAADGVGQGGAEAAAQQLQAAVRGALLQAAAAGGTRFLHTSSVCFPGCLHLVMTLLMGPPVAGGGGAAAGGLPILDGQALLQQLQDDDAIRLMELALLRQAQGQLVADWVYQASAEADQMLAFPEGDDGGAGEVVPAPAAPPLAAAAAQDEGAGSGGAELLVSDAMGVHLSPVVLASGSAPLTYGEREVAVHLAPEWVAALAARGHGLRIIVAPAQDLLPHLDMRVGEGEAGWPANAVLALQLPSSCVARPLVLVTLLVTPPPPTTCAAPSSMNGVAPLHGADVLVGQLPLLVLAPSAAAEVADAYDEMVAQEGSAALAFSRHFTPMAWDMALVLAGPTNPGDADYAALVADALADTFSQACMVTCLQLVLEAACRHGLIEIDSGLELTTLRQGPATPEQPSGSLAKAPAMADLKPAKADAVPAQQAAAPLAGPSVSAAAAAASLQAAACAPGTPSSGARLAREAASLNDSASSATCGGCPSASGKVVSCDDGAGGGQKPTHASCGPAAADGRWDAVLDKRSKARQLVALDVLVCCGLLLRQLLLLQRSGCRSQECVPSPTWGAPLACGPAAALVAALLALRLFTAAGAPAWRGWVSAAAHIVHACCELAVLGACPGRPLAALLPLAAAHALWAVAHPLHQQLGVAPTALVVVGRLAHVSIAGLVADRLVAPPRALLAAWSLLCTAAAVCCDAALRHAYQRHSLEQTAAAAGLRNGALADGCARLWGVGCSAAGGPAGAAGKTARRAKVA